MSCGPSPQVSSARRARKRPATPVLGGQEGSYKNVNNDFVCPICFDLIDEAYMTKCGHSFCHSCIERSLERNNRCPRCGVPIENPSQIFPNFSLMELIRKHKAGDQKHSIDKQPNVQDWQCLSQDLDLVDINNVMSLLVMRKQLLEQGSKVSEARMLRTFLEEVRGRKEKELEKLQRQLEILNQDCKAADEKVQKLEQRNFNCPDHLVPNGSASLEQPGSSTSHGEQSTVTDRRIRPDTAVVESFAGGSANRPTFDMSVAQKKRKLNQHFEDLEKVYLDTRTGAGFVRDALVDLHYPITEMICESKISCIAWNPYKKHMLSSADYNGIVYMWDTSTNMRTQMFQEHEKRCWSVDFNTMDPKMLASGSDDTKVKLWDWDRSRSVMTIEGGANVCCVKFNPTTRYNLAFGSADHCVHYYDLRHPKKALHVFRGHGKAVSYVKFLNGSDMVSASTDSQLKMWTLGCHNAISTFKGHINEKNFVGLATDGDYVACGSENNSLYVYYKGLSRQILTYKFEPARRLIEKPGKDDDSTEFVSAVTWKPNSNVLVAANSQGLVKLLELV
ncbi:E3 ubiquitin-protein ligase rfwd2 [Plakobranchus ocellatus]|uniref:E3 ubiquitin-protein ligase rfwd2 n=1 Tax=Plakobranchus ocellatus TaxID=259542 RepID=A0AAV3Y7D4_9GAST|nr:E3 ubiquitin-protein ligase rfwd2 [Plakobranchus ocellatus]